MASRRRTRPGSSRGRRRASTAAALVAVSSRRTPPGVSSAKRRWSRQIAWVRNATSSSRRSESRRRVTVASSRTTSWSPLASRVARPIDTASSRSVFLPWPWENTRTRAASLAGSRPPVHRRPRGAGPKTGPRHGSPPPPTGGASTEPRTASARGNPPWCSRTRPINGRSRERVQHRQRAAGLVRINADEHLVHCLPPPRRDGCETRRAMQLRATQTSLQPLPAGWARTGRTPFVSQPTGGSRFASDPVGPNARD